MTQRRQVVQLTPDAPGGTEVQTLTVAGTAYTTWDEAVEREQQACAVVSELLSGDVGLALHIPAGQSAEDILEPAGTPAGRLVRFWAALDGVTRLQAHRVAGPYGALRLGRADREP